MGKRACFQRPAKIEMLPWCNGRFAREIRMAKSDPSSVAGLIATKSSVAAKLQRTYDFEANTAEGGKKPE